MVGDWRSVEVHAGKSLDFWEGTIVGNMDVKGHSGGVSGGNKKRVIGNRRKCDLCYKVAKSLGELCSEVLWKVEFTKRWHCILAEEISKPGVETLGSSWQLIVKGERREMN